MGELVDHFGEHIHFDIHALTDRVSVKNGDFPGVRDNGNVDPMVLGIQMGQG